MSSTDGECVGVTQRRGPDISGASDLLFESQMLGLSNILPKHPFRSNIGMSPARPRPASINIPAAFPTIAWNAIRPPTPRRATYPSPSKPAGHGSDELPPVPPLSYWDPETPSPFATTTATASPRSPMNPFLAPPQSSMMTNLHAFLPKAAPLLSASPLSIFDQAMSPTAPTFLHSRTVTPTPTKSTFFLPASPLLSPRFMFPRTPPPCPGKRREASVYHVVVNVADRKGSVASMVRMREVMRLEFYQFLFLKKQKEIELSQQLAREKEMDKTHADKWTIRRLWRQLAGDKEYAEKRVGSKGFLNKGIIKLPKLRRVLLLQG